MGCFPGEVYKNLYNLPNAPNQKQALIQIIRTQPQKSLNYLYEHQKYYTFMNYQKFLKQLLIKMKVLTRQTQEVDLLYQKKTIKKNTGQNTSTQVQKKLTFPQRLSFHTNKIIQIVTTCIQINKMLEQEYKKVKEQNDKNKLYWTTSIQQIIKSQKTIRTKSKIKKQIIVQDSMSTFDNSKRHIVQQTQKLSNHIEDCKTKIQKSLVAQDEQINDQQRKQLVMTQVQTITYQYEQKITKLKEQIQQLQSKLKQQRRQSNSVFSQLNSSVSRLKKQKQEIERQREQLRIKLTQKQQECRQLSIKIVSMQNAISSISSKQTKQSNYITPDDVRQSFTFTFIFGRFINSKVIFQEYHEGKRYQKDLDCIFSPLKINSSRLIYSYDRIRPNNMFDYVKNQENLILLAKLKNGYIIGGFSKKGFRLQDSTNRNNQCFIFTIYPCKQEQTQGKEQDNKIQAVKQGKQKKSQLKHKNHQFYKLVQKNRTSISHEVKLDKNFLRFGTNQLRIQCGTNNGYSAVGSNGCMFQYSPKNNQNQQNKVTNKDMANSKCINKFNLIDFLGQKQQKFDVQYYEIFQLFLQENQHENKQQIQQNNNNYYNSNIIA